jgi:aminotransferase
MQRYIVPRVQSIPPSGIRAFFDLVQSSKDVISLGVGEPDFVAPWHVRDAAVHTLERGKLAYTPNAGLIELREEIGQYMHDRFGVHYEPTSEVIVTVGGSEAIDLALRVLVQEGDDVLVPEPTYVSYAPVTTLCGATPIPVSTAEHGFVLTVEALERAVTPRTKVLLACFPSNPTGATMTREQWLPIAAFAKQKDIVIISDEIYAELTYNGDPISVASLPELRDRTVVVSGFSKAFAMTGWRIGYACGHRDIIAAMLKVHQYTMMCAPTTSQWAAVQSLREGRADTARMVASYNQRRRFVLTSFAQMGMQCHEPTGAFYAFPAIASFGLSDEQFAKRLLLEGKVAAIPGSVFGIGGEGHIRCSYATSIQQLTIAMERMQAFVTALRAEMPE